MSATNELIELSTDVGIVYVWAFVISCLVFTTIAFAGMVDALTDLRSWGHLSILLLMMSIIWPVSWAVLFCYLVFCIYENLRAARALAKRMESKHPFVRRAGEPAPKSTNSTFA